MLNDVTLARAVIGLFRYTQGYLKGKGDAASPRLVIAHDVRFYSRHFCELSASIWTRLGGEAFMFDGPRPTPQLSFTVRHIGAHAGAVITASHNPPHDNGFKAYFVDGGQVVPPDDAGIVAQVNAVPLTAVPEFLLKDLSRVTTLGRPEDDAYMDVAASAVLDPAMLRAARLGVVYTNIHGVGAVHAPALLIHAGCRVSEVLGQAAFDPRFPTVKSPNPENAEALSMAVATAKQKDCSVVMATDPDCDRMGVAVRGRAGAMELLTGNQIGSLIAEYRLTKYKELGWIPAGGSPNACIIKTFVTTQLQDAIPGWAHGIVKGHRHPDGIQVDRREDRAVRGEAEGGHGSRVELRRDAVPGACEAPPPAQHVLRVRNRGELRLRLPNDFRARQGWERRLPHVRGALRLGGEGRGAHPSPSTWTRSTSSTGSYLEDTINLYYEGASGSAKIKRILDTYRSSRPQAFGDVRVTAFQDFGRERILDADGEEIPKQDLYVATLSNGYRFAARGSGTEPKMKFYLFASDRVADAAGLPSVKARVRDELARLKNLIEADARSRAEG